MERTFIFNPAEGSANNSLLASILPSLQNRGIDTGYLMGLLGGANNNGGFFGNNGGFQDIIALIVIAAIFGNGNFGFGGNNRGNSTEREMIMSAIQRNGLDLNQLASSINCSVGQIESAINAVSTQLCNVGNQIGMSGQQIINSIQSGDSALASQIANCCCQTQNAIQGVRYDLATQACDTRNAIQNSTRDIIDNQNANYRGLMDFMVQSKIDALQAELLRRIPDDKLSVRGCELYLNFLVFAREFINRCSIVAVLSGQLDEIAQRQQ